MSNFKTNTAGVNSKKQRFYLGPRRMNLGNGHPGKWLLSFTWDPKTQQHTHTNTSQCCRSILSAAHVDMKFNSKWSPWLTSWAGINVRLSLQWTEPRRSGKEEGPPTILRGVKGLLCFLEEAEPLWGADLNQVPWFQLFEPPMLVHPKLGNNPGPYFQSEFAAGSSPALITHRRRGKLEPARL